MLMDKNILIKVKPLKPTFVKEVNPHFKAAAKLFFKGEKGAFGSYVSTTNALVYRTLSTVDGYNQEVICLRIIQDGKVHYLGNSSRFKFVGSVVAFGNRSNPWGQTLEQASLVASGVPMLPFTAFSEAGLKLMNTEILDQGAAETVKRQTGKDRKGNPIFSDVHFTGAALFKNGPKIFLFDIDRVELSHGIFNPFIVELSKDASTIQAAYEGLKPDKVKAAELEGLKVYRQGEFFFVKRADLGAYKPAKDRRDGAQTTAILQAQGNREHEASALHHGTGYVSGTVKHWGREHRDLVLDGWFEVIPNTAVRAFTLTGDVD